MVRYFIFTLISLTAISCLQQEKQGEAPKTPITVELSTTKGLILLELSDKTPLHRDNFIKIVNEGKLDSMIFHRVLDGFVVQAGEYDSVTVSRLDSLDVEKYDYTIPAELDSSLYHKRGALGAARSDNPARASASLSFYIVQRGARGDSLIDVDEKRINGWLQKHYFINAEEHKVWKDSLLFAEREKKEELYAILQDTIASMAKSFDFEAYTIPEHHRHSYRTLGGTPHLDQNYTVFGEVIRGMAVVDSIAVVKVNKSGRPLEEVYILRAKVLE